jgi:hypothetical protein
LLLKHESMPDRTHTHAAIFQKLQLTIGNEDVFIVARILSFDGRQALVRLAMPALRSCTTQLMSLAFRSPLYPTPQVEDICPQPGLPAERFTAPWDMLTVLDNDSPIKKKNKVMPTPALCSRLRPLSHLYLSRLHIFTFWSHCQSIRLSSRPTRTPFCKTARPPGPAHSTRQAPYLCAIGRSIHSFACPSILILILVLWKGDRVECEPV